MLHAALPAAFVALAALTAAAILDRDANLTGLRGLVWAQPMTGAVLTLALLSRCSVVGCDFTGAR